MFITKEMISESKQQALITTAEQCHNNTQQVDTIGWLHHNYNILTVYNVILNIDYAI